MEKMKIGDKVNLMMKPILMREWHIIKFTKKSVVVRKKFTARYGRKDYIGDCYYLPKKNILKITKLEK